jgi:mannose/cellobiose epimerase-like protein (N-acyl-D-glucosamine 2-epimerase family)
MRFYDPDEKVVYWYHGIDVQGQRETKVFASEFGDDFDGIPAYEQIYALAGPMQTYRITGDPRILQDAELTVDLFDRFFLDRSKGGYFSHLDPITLDPRSNALGANKAKKNWNSVGDHAPAYLINLYLATGERRYADFLEYTFDTIAQYFPDYDHSLFVQEKFHEDWSHDTTHMWQQNRGVVGHNLKIAWNLMRMHSLKPKPQYETLARRIAAEMPKVGMDRQRGGWYDVMERVLRGDEEVHRFAFHDRKAWWQQEQGILAYLILHGVLGDQEYRRLARESAAFYNAFFLDHDDGAVYFNVLANGIPYLMGTERFKGSHSMSGYHSTELCYLAATYTNLLITKQPLDLHFKPYPNGFRHNILRVSPDLLPPGSLRLSEVWANGEKYSRFDVDALTVRVPDSKEAVPIKVRIEPKQ